MDNEAINPSEVFAVMVGGTIFLSILAGFIIYFMFLYRQKQLLHKEEQKRLKAEYEQAVTESQVEIQNEILHHVSAEIHDNLGQVASLLKIHLHTLPIPESEPDKGKFIESKELLAKLIYDLKSLSIGLNTDYITENGLAYALENVVNRINKTGSMKAHISAPIDKINLDRGKEIFLFRMGQEILNNMLKHSQANNIYVDLQLDDNNTLIATYRDDGIGFDVEEIRESGLKNQHSGLHNLYKRCKLINAELKIRSIAHQGSEFIITLAL